MKKEKNDYQKIKEEEKQKQDAYEVRVSLYEQYEEMKSDADIMRINGQKNTNKYRALIKNIRGHEVALNIPRHKTYQNPGFNNENTNNIYLNKANKEINDYKAKEEIISDFVGGVVTELFKVDEEARKRRLVNRRIRKLDREDRKWEKQEIINKVKKTKKIGKISKNGLQLKQHNGFFGYVDENDKWIIKPKYIDAKPFKNGKAEVVTKFGKKLIINKKGKKI